MKQEAKILEMSKWFGEWFLDENTRQAGKMTAELHPYEQLFSPVQINRLTLKNRLVMAPMGNISMCEETGRPNEKMIAYFVERAKGGVGLITTGLIPVTHHIDNSLTELGELSYFPRIDRSRTVFAGWRDLAQRCHSHGARVFLQASAGLGRVGNPQCLVNSMKFPGSASFNPNWYMPQVPCLRLSDHHIRGIVKAIGQAAADAKSAGLDGIYLHGHEGYLMEQLTNPAFNRRKLGRYADPQRFGVEMIEYIRERCGERFPIMYRIDLSLALNETYGERMAGTSMKKFQNGRTVAESLDYMKNLVKAGVDMFDVDLGCYDNWWLPHPPEGMPPGCFLEIAQISKEYFANEKILSNAGVPVPVVGVGKLGNPDLAERALREQKCDLVMLGRPLLADPDWPNKARAGRVGEIIPCIGCQEGCINEFVEGGHPQCAVNPRTAFEEIYPETPAPAEKPKKIAVIGGGPAGVTAAVTAARRGHSVTLYEKNSQLGGRIIQGCVPGIKVEIANYLEYLRTWAASAQASYGLQLQLNTEATTALLQAGGFDEIIVAAGTLDTSLPLPGLESANAHQAVAVLQDPRLLANAQKIVVIGGGVVGCEVAYFLAKEHQKQVTVIEMDQYFMNHACTANRGYLLKYLYDANVKLCNCTRLLSFAKDGVNVRRNTSKTVPDPYLSWTPILPENVLNPLAPKLKEEPKDEFLAADAVVLAAGGRPNEALFHRLQKEFPTLPVHNIGDSFQGGKVLEATRNGYALAIRI
ncbi:MAG: FAD-dependent oxidoreductase [Oscillospiraceae bacterium]|jgi:2-enoate reductase|nr:FAD-dependent oxidoreductase [Oscillospiraceae bacterium]